MTKENGDKMWQVFKIILPLLTLVGGIIFFYGSLVGRVDNHETRITKNEETISKVSETLTEIKMDVKWIKERYKK